MVIGFTSCSKKVAETVITDGTVPAITETQDHTTESGQQVDNSAKEKEKEKEEAAKAQLAKLVQKVNATRSDLSQVSGHISLDLAMGSQKVKVGGDLKLKRNSIIQITLQALGGLITVGRLEFTPEDMLVMDNMNKQYVKLPYAEVPFLKDNGIDFYTFQALLYDELFVPGSKGDIPQPTAFKQEQKGKDVTLVHQTKSLLLSFLVNASSALVQQTSIKGTKANRGMECTYLDRGKVKNQTFPNRLEVKVDLGQQAILAKMDITKLRNDDSWKANPTTVDSKKFKKLTLQQVWKTVMSVAK